MSLPLYILLTCHVKVNYLSRQGSRRAVSAHPRSRPLFEGALFEGATMRAIEQWTDSESSAPPPRNPHPSKPPAPQSLARKGLGPAGPVTRSRLRRPARRGWRTPPTACAARPPRERTGTHAARSPWRPRGMRFLASRDAIGNIKARRWRRRGDVFGAAGPRPWPRRPATSSGHVVRRVQARRLRRGDEIPRLGQMMCP